jgi:hypothetical protein
MAPLSSKLVSSCPSTTKQDLLLIELDDYREGDGSHSPLNVFTTSIDASSWRVTVYPVKIERSGMSSNRVEPLVELGWRQHNLPVNPRF